MPQTVRIDERTRRALHAARRTLGRSVVQALGLEVPVPVHFKDPLVAQQVPAAGLDPDFLAPWEPGLGNGPTSARFRVMPVGDRSARWDGAAGRFTDADGGPIDAEHIGSAEFRQASVWAVLQNTLEHVEGPFGLGRRLDWGFPGQRLKVFSEAGDNRNAEYSREQQALNFFYFSHAGGRVHTCLSSDIVNHELGHAVLDGIRPMYLEAPTKENMAFHESVGDILALLMALRNNEFRKVVGERTAADLQSDPLASEIARQFGAAVSDQPHLRSGLSPLTMDDLEASDMHDASQILTAAVFSFLARLAARHRERECVSTAEALWWALRRVQVTFLQALDLLPPVDPRFADLAQAMDRSASLADPVDDRGYRALLGECLAARGIATGATEPLPRLEFAADPAALAGRAEAYRFLDENRRALGIPVEAELTLDGCVTARKRAPDGQALPRQIVIPYHWTEEVTASGYRLAVPCGATLVLDAEGTPLVWARKPGAPDGSDRVPTLAASIARSLASGEIGSAQTEALVSARMVDGRLHFRARLRCAPSLAEEKT